MCNVYKKCVITDVHFPHPHPHTRLQGQARIQHREARQINNAHIRMTSTKDSKGNTNHVSDTIYNRREYLRGQRKQFYEKYIDCGANVLYEHMANNSEIKN